MLSFDQALKEFYLPQLEADLKRDMARTLFYDPNPVYGPPVPAWLQAGKLFDDAPMWNPPDSYWDDTCECCGRGDY